MTSDSTVSDVNDPLSGLIGPSLFPRSIKASADVRVPSDPKDLDSIHNFMKSLELRSPEKLMSEAKRIVDGGAELLKSSLASFAESVGITDAIPAKCKDKPRQRRPGLGLDLKRAPFVLRNKTSQPQVIEESIVDLDKIEDPDEYWDAYDRMENAQKEIQKLLGGNLNEDDFSLYEPSNKPRRRRPGILGETYHYKHRYPSMSSKNDEALMSSQEILVEDIPSVPEDNSQKIVDENILNLSEDNSQTIVDEDIPSAPEDNEQELVDEDIRIAPKDPILDDDLEEFEIAGSIKKTENEFSYILKEMLSCNLEDLEGAGALNLLQERLNIKPIDPQNLGMTEFRDVGRTSIAAMSGSFRKPSRSSLIIDSVLKNLHKKPTSPVNRVSSPIPPRSPFASLSFLKKKIMQPNPLRDPFSVDVDLSPCLNDSAARPKANLPEQADEPYDLGMNIESESHADVSNTEPLASTSRAPEIMGNTDVLPTQLVDENASMQNAHADSEPFEETDKNIDGEMNIDKDELNPSVPEEEYVDDMSSRQQSDPAQQPEVRQAKIPRKKRVAGEKERTRKDHPMRTSLADVGTSFETGVRKSKRIKMRPLEFWKGERFLYGRVDDSMKLIGLKYVSPGKPNNVSLKVKPFIPVEASEYKELLELAARH